MKLRMNMFPFLIVSVLFGLILDAMDSLEEKVKVFFSKCKTANPPLKKEEKEETFLKLKEVSALGCFIYLNHI